MTELILHIGHPKCGSSTIQDFLAANWRQLRSERIGLADKRLSLFNDLSQGASPVSFFAKIRRQQTDASTSVKALKALKAECLGAGLDKVVVSAENLADEILAGKLADGFAQFEKVHIVYYIRRPDDWLLSSWKQWHVKAGRSLDQHLDIHIRNKGNMYRKIIEAWLTELPDARLTVRALDRSLLDGEDLLADFAARLDIDPARLKAVENSNFAINDSLALAFSKSTFLFDNSHDNTLTNFLKHTLGDSVSRSDFDPIKPTRRQEILNAHSEEFDWLEEHVFEKGHLDNWRKPVRKMPYRELTDTDAILAMQAVNMQLLVKLLQDK